MPYHRIFKFNLTTFIICSLWFIIYLTQFLVLNLDGSFVVLCNKFLIFWYSIIIYYYYYINLRSSITFCFFTGDIYFSLSISSFYSELFCGEEFYRQLNHQLFLFLLIALFEAALSASVAEAFDCIYFLSFYLYFINNFPHISRKR